MIQAWNPHLPTPNRASWAAYDSDAILQLTVTNAQLQLPRLPRLQFHWSRAQMFSRLEFHPGRGGLTVVIYLQTPWHMFLSHFDSSAFSQITLRMHTGLPKCWQKWVRFARKAQPSRLTLQWRCSVFLRKILIIP